MREYRFVRMDIEGEVKITDKLNKLLDEGWTVVSHTDYDGEYSFVLIKDRG